jgi:hypothetical protein
MNRHTTNTVVIKDPIALLSAEHLANKYEIEVVCMIRHPLAFCSSIKKWNWAFPFSHFLKQPMLIERHFFNYRSEIERFSKDKTDIVDQAILLWNLLHEVIKTYKTHHPDWFCLRHEDAVTNPLREFRYLYDHLGIAYSNDIESAIISSGEINEGDTQDDSYKARNRETVLDTWKRRLTTQEVERIYKGTHALRKYFYPDEPGISTVPPSSLLRVNYPA